MSVNGYRGTDHAPVPNDKIVKPYVSHPDWSDPRNRVHFDFRPVNQEAELVDAQWMFV
ncbi:hypothetical protein [Streptomyces sp. A30]|uniref:hypothetical protein n=1 Tax=Streptomyces sp. A30 TaxID=2789273 RepID=UPI0039808124